MFKTFAGIAGERLFGQSGSSTGVELFKIFEAASNIIENQRTENIDIKVENKKKEKSEKPCSWLLSLGWRTWLILSAILLIILVIYFKDKSGNVLSKIFKPFDWILERIFGKKPTYSDGYIIGLNGGMPMEQAPKEYMYGYLAGRKAKIAEEDIERRKSMEDKMQIALMSGKNSGSNTAVEVAKEGMAHRIAMKYADNLIGYRKRYSYNNRYRKYNYRNNAYNRRFYR